MRSAAAVPDLARWRDEARALLAAEIAPADVAWTAPGAAGVLFETPLAAAPATARVPARFLRLADDAILHRGAGTHATLYRVLWRLSHGEPALLDDAADPDVRALTTRAAQVTRDLHQMHAFVRFRVVADDEGDHRVAWYAPAHHIVERGAAFFRDRFPAMRWTILTPERSAHYDGHALRFGPGAPRHTAPQGEDDLEDLWRTYYASIFNPARANPRAMRQHMPRRLWPQLPEATEIGGLLAAAPARVVAMDPRPAITGAPSLAALGEQARACTACELCGPATQVVFGEGPADARLVLVGEQPGDQEDLAGRPFIGPAGEVLDAALADAGLDRAAIYVTNAVKHFRFEPRGKRRIHKRPSAYHVRACKPWLGAELAQLQPRVIVCLGATAALSLIGSRFRMTEQRGQRIETPWAAHLLASHHPAAILRVDAAARPRYEAELRADLALARSLL
ncbi:MAG TPA: UdgX family uracil-DNA binding protein [Kofleriaceae bacterium]|nr:UdgX family uracil-DNA binding protein [Kofleriaceae bacterium]